MKIPRRFALTMAIVSLLTESDVSLSVISCSLSTMVNFFAYSSESVSELLRLAIARSYSSSSRRLYFGGSFLVNTGLLRLSFIIRDVSLAIEVFIQGVHFEDHLLLELESFRVITELERI